ncbi:conserved protein of unknown function (plasmid) [Rhodovastum atsumiense]|uniref:Putative exodeoxyribonuclease 8 PDDEXK-like domain-containing protein n=1 Tax=Rhodovastum atsumiense TaxID=504468 RepID=A0A5M6INY5_9PROT|nr:PD-(D/E)XK nuclease-like domain-containing protein [Rhodovastum atsumiense]KAA5609697.1 hypothetical protein F1189_23340 [Rhodovastum atsumiense]CAH2606479.1 conserved protein of unknown function [Rhodovastum atsumiense]
MAVRLTEPGVYSLRAADYHADPAPEPSLSNSLIKMLLQKSPRHVQYAHPRLSPNFKPKKVTDAMEDGSILHSLILGTGVPITEVSADNWTSQRAKAARAEARAAGRIPVLSRRLAELHECADAAVEQMMEIEACEPFFDPDARSEVTLLWQLGPLWCRAMADRLAPGGVFFDIKTTSTSVAPADFSRTLEREHATQDVFYRSGGNILAELGLMEAPTAFRFVAIETYEPFCIAVYEAQQTLIEAATTDVHRATATWARCLLNNDWPGYGKEINRVEASVGRMIRAEEAKLDWKMAA